MVKLQVGLEAELFGLVPDAIVDGGEEALEEEKEEDQVDLLVHESFDFGMLDLASDGVHHDLGVVACVDDGSHDLN